MRFSGLGKKELLSLISFFLQQVAVMLFVLKYRFGKKETSKQTNKKAQSSVHQIFRVRERKKKNPTLLMFMTNEEERRQKDF